MCNMMSGMASGDLHVIFAGGGTGGHIFPALAIAEELVAPASGASGRVTCSWLVSQRPLDAKILGAARVGEQPVAFVALGAQPLILRPRGLWRFLNSWGASVRAARAEIRVARAAVGVGAGQGGRVVVAAMGGFVAAPAAIAARAERVPVVLVNLDAVPGQANRLIARYASRIVSAAPVEGAKFATWEVTPPIVRRGAVSTLSPQDARRALGLDPDRPTLMITGGSQGAGSINEWMLALLASSEGRTALAGWQVLHQTGPEKADAPSILAKLNDAYQHAGIRAVVTPFVDGMGMWWASATLAICRSGAGNVGEVWANRVPAVFMPYPYHKDQHQRINARQLEGCGGAVVCRDHVAPSENARWLSPTVCALLADGAKVAAMRTALEKLPAADGAARVAALLVARASSP
jgi:UDP-N-acetylglucosamine--N-acetylmuramyl-(pentapeptide) pyrophosphoryl-undecaprenol N-acetylglucosamine transferase